MTKFVVNSAAIIKDMSEKQNLNEHWVGSKHEPWNSMNNDGKGKCGTLIYQQILEEKGFETKVISAQGDLLYRKPEEAEWTRAEVKASKATFSFCKDGTISESFWFNQIRPKQKLWNEVVLVCVAPNHVRIYVNGRNSFNKLFSEFNNGAKNSLAGLSHIGTDELAQVKLINNSKTCNLDEWVEFYSDQEEGKY